jgi:hypothetical protein
MMMIDRPGKALLTRIRLRPGFARTILRIAASQGVGRECRFVVILACGGELETGSSECRRVRERSLE